MIFMSHAGVVSVEQGMPDGIDGWWFEQGGLLRVQGGRVSRASQAESAALGVAVTRTIIERYSTTEGLRGFFDRKEVATLTSTLEKLTLENLFGMLLCVSQRVDLTNNGDNPAPAGEAPTAGTEARWPLLVAFLGGGVQLVVSESDFRRVAKQSRITKVLHCFDADGMACRLHPPGAAQRVEVLHRQASEVNRALLVAYLKETGDDVRGVPRITEALPAEITAREDLVSLPNLFGVAVLVSMRGIFASAKRSFLAKVFDAIMDGVIMEAL